MDLSDNPKDSLYPAIATDSKNNVHVVWSDEVSGTSTSMTYLFYKMFNRTTNYWSSIENISLSNDMSWYPDIVVDLNDNVHVVWEGHRGEADFDIFYRNMTFATGIWGDIKNVTNDDSGSLQTVPKIAVNSSGDIQVVWQEDSYIAGKVAPNGNWDAVASVSGVHINNDGANGIHAGAFDLAADQTYFYLIWSLDTTPDKIYCVNSSDGTLADEGGDATLLYSANIATTPTIFISNNTSGFGKVYVAFTSNIDGQYDVLTLNATINSQGFGQLPVNVSNAANPDFRLPQIVADKSGRVFVLYAEVYGGVGQYYLHLTNSSAYGQFQYIQDPQHLGNVPLNNPAMAIDQNGSLHCVWEDDQDIGIYSGGSNTDIFYRTFHRDTPQVRITSPKNQTLLGKFNTITGTCDTDTKYVNVSYQPLGSSSWTYIGGIENDTTNFMNGWSLPFPATGISYPNITIRANATDFYGASDEFFIYNLTLDGEDPKTVALVNIQDSFGNSYSKGDGNFTGTITFTYNVADAPGGSGVKNVTLYDGSTELTSYGANTTRNQIIITMGDVTYNSLKFRATDWAGNYNESEVIPRPIRFDHTNPYPMFKVPLVEYAKFRQTVRIEVNATAGNDTSDWKNVTFRNSTNGILWTTLGTNSSGVGGVFSYEFDISSIFEDPTHMINATVFDFSGRNVTISTHIYIDNNAPDFIIDVNNNFADDDYWRLIGIELYIRILSDNDTVQVDFYNKTDNMNPFSFLLLSNTSAEQYTPDSKIFRCTWNLEWTAALAVFIKVDAWDDMGNRNSTDYFIDLGHMYDDYNGFILRVDPNLPDPVTDVNATLQPDGKSILIEWDTPVDKTRVEGYKIYRFAYAPDIYYINLLNPSRLSEFKAFLNNEGLLIADTVDNGGVLDKDADHFLDENLDANVYYYVVITETIFTIVSTIPNVPAVEVEGTQPTRNADDTFDKFLQFVVYALIALWILIPIVGYSITRRLAKRDLIDFTMDVNVIKGFQGPKSFEKDVSDLDLKMRKELGMDVTSPAETEFLQQEIVRSIPGVEVKETTLKNCPQCGWVLSAGATKCIRCGYVLGNPTGQPKEGKK